ncbi:MAG: class I SAM-dependent methyltransferase, partial [Planctomycetes bacterium]|nr:class I SAM-dependent methyltransferase [Planctomycetota bacterium]
MPRAGMRPTTSSASLREGSLFRSGVTGLLFLTGFLFLAGRALGASGATHPAAGAVMNGFDGGMVVHVGCADGRNTLKLGQAGTWVVRGLDRDPDKIRAARERIVDAGRYGPVSVAVWRGGVLPFVDNSVDVILLDNGAEVGLEECVRALRPGGKVCFQKGGTWQRFMKQHPRNTDEWTHALYDASGGSVSKDLVAGPPERLQWTGGPSWTRHHEAVSGFQTMVTAAGR